MSDVLLLQLANLRAEVARLRQALDQIEGSPEDPLEVQAIARAALKNRYREDMSWRADGPDWPADVPGPIA